MVVDFGVGQVAAFLAQRDQGLEAGTLGVQIDQLGFRGNQLFAALAAARLGDGLGGRLGAYRTGCGLGRRSRDGRRRSFGGFCGSGLGRRFGSNDFDRRFSDGAFAGVLAAGAFAGAFLTGALTGAFLAGALAGAFLTGALAGAGFFAGAGFLGAGFLAAGLAAALDLLCLAISFGMTILGWSTMVARYYRPLQRRDALGKADSARRESAGEPQIISHRGSGRRGRCAGMLLCQQFGQALPLLRTQVLGAGIKFLDFSA